MKYSKEEKAEALSTLRALLPIGSAVYTKLNHVSRSGMSRSITPFAIVDGEPRYMAWSVCVLFGQIRDKYDGVKMDGCGMDMGFALVYNLSYLLYPEGFGLKMEDKATSKVKTPKSKAEAEKLFNRGFRSFGRNGDTSGWDNNGGYALNQKWI